MTTLYKAVKIQSAEQAEALPVGTVVIRTRVGVIEKGRRGWWSGLNQVPDQTPIGASALVPIEAEEETREHPYRVEERVGYVYHQPVQQVRYKTRWESA